MKQYRYKFIIFFLMSLGLRNIYSQNLVPNGSFETYTACPTAAAFYKVAPWCGLGGGEEAFNICFNMLIGPGPGGFGIPYTFFGFQYPKTGDGLGSVEVFITGNGNQNRREYLQVPLTQTLQSGKTYCGTMYLNLYNESRHTTDNVGMYFSSTPFACNQAMPTPQTIAPLNVIPQIANTPGNFIKDTLNWIEVSGTFVATGNEEYLTIGNFYDDANTSTVLVNPPSAYTVTYFLIDDVSLEEIQPATTIGTTSLCAGDSVLLAPVPPPESATYNWQPSTGLSCTNCASPKASPHSTTTYTLTKTQCKATTTAIATITIKTDCSLDEHITLPNTFTPNEDGINDTFMLTLPTGFIVKEFKVYNRWGNIEKQDNTLPSQNVILWDGRTTTGEVCSPGVYYYVLHYTDAKGELQKKNGFVTLFR